MASEMYEIIYKLIKYIFDPLYGTHSSSREFGHIPDAIPLLQKANHIPILLPHLLF